MNVQFSYNSSDSDVRCLLQPKIELQNALVLTRTKERRFSFYLTSAQPDFGFIADLHNKKYQLLTPLRVEFDVNKNRVLAYERKIGTYGAGSTKEEATNDLKSMLLEMFEQLCASEQSLSHALADKLVDLRSVIKLK